MSRAPDRNVQAPVTSSSNAAPDWKAVATAIEPSVVSVQLQSGGQGSGVILDKEGRIITNYHVVAEDGRLGVILNDGRGYAAKVVGTDPHVDRRLPAVREVDVPFHAGLHVGGPDLPASAGARAAWAAPGSSPACGPRSEPARRRWAIGRRRSRARSAR